MAFMFNKNEPLYIQIANQIEEMIFTGTLKEGEQVPSTTQLSQELQINPATVLKGMNILVGKNLIKKKRGMGMFVCENASKIIQQQRHDNFYNEYVKKTVDEAKKLNISAEELKEMIERGY